MNPPSPPSHAPNASVVVLLSAYNGVRFLPEQLDSLRAQTLPPTVVLVRDDGSSDGTPEFLCAYAAAHPGFPLRVSAAAPGRNLGWRGSFRALLETAPEAEFYAFCDQDDRWMPGKLEGQVRALRAAAAGAADKPLLCSCAFEWADSNLRPLARCPAPQRPPAFRDVLFHTPAIGFTIVVNAALRRLVLARGIPDGVPHDRWCLLAAAAFGRVLHDPSTGALYRRHGAAATPAGASRARLLASWFRREIRGSGFTEFTGLLAAFRDRFGELLSPADRNLLDRFAGPPSGPSVRVRRALFPGRLRPSLGGEVALRLSFLLAPDRPAP